MRNDTNKEERKMKVKWQKPEIETMGTKRERDKAEDLLRVPPVVTLMSA